MANSELMGVLFTYVCTILCAIPLGKYISKIYLREKSFSDTVFDKIEKSIFFICSINASENMSWKEHLRSFIFINAVWFVISMLVLTNMDILPLNPDAIASMSPDLAFNTTISFITNTNLQHYSGESGLSYIGQMTLMLWQFISAGSGMAICGMAFIAMREKTSSNLGNFYDLFIRSSIRILLPLAFIAAIIYVFNNVPMTFEGKDTITTLQGETIEVSRGPVAAFVAIKQLGTNGGGFFGTNSAHPLENPNYLTNIIQNISIMVIPIAMIFAFGYITKKKKMAIMIFSVMSIGFFALLIPTLIHESSGNNAINAMGIANSMQAIEGKEVRFGSAASSFWAISTTCTSNGSVNAMHDSLMPISGLSTMVGMMMNCFYGGVGVGFLNFYIFIIITVFISGLLVGRTPELLGKKIEAREMKIAMIIALLHPFLILSFTALSSYLYSSNPQEYASWLTNKGYHGFSEMLYEFTSSSANNGSGFEGLGDNTPFWNITCGLVMLFARYLPIIGPIAIVGLLHEKKHIPIGNGTLATDSATFGFMILFIIIIIAALSFFPVLTLGPLAEYFTFQF